ncbi:hypothetical protein Scep_025844 [Stephania cephalantha]|uniref:Uncharacterized protein n=1 Tax=Stephania cephalantha TaxID=152367 RepID=A0AAP0EIY9_9MAGN
MFLGGPECICSNDDHCSGSRSVGLCQLTSSFNKNLYISFVTPGKDVESNAIVTLK